MDPLTCTHVVDFTAIFGLRRTAEKMAGRCEHDGGGSYDGDLVLRGAQLRHGAAVYFQPSETEVQARAFLESVRRGVLGFQTSHH